MNYTRAIIVLAIIITMIISPVSALFSGVYSYGYQVNVTADASTTPLTNYPFVITLSNDTGVSSTSKIYTNGSTRADWKDIDILDLNGTPGTFFLEYNESTATEIPLYVNISSITTTGDDGFRIFFGNASASTSNESATPTLLQFHGVETATFNATPIVDPVNTSYLAHWRYTTAGSTLQFGMGDASYASIANGHRFQGAQTNTPTYTTASSTTTTVNYGTIGTINVYYRFAINRTNTYVNYSRGSEAPKQATSNMPTTLLGLWFSDEGTGAASQNFSHVRKWVNPEPSATAFSVLESGEPPLASLTSSDNPSYTGNVVTFTDTSSETPTEWNITFDGGTTWDNSSSPPWTNTFTLPATYNITMLCSNAYGTSAPFYLDQVVINSTNYTAMDMYQTGSYVRTVHVEDTDGVPLSGASVTWSDGQTATTDSVGNCNVTINSGIYTIVTALSGYYTDQLSVAVEGTGTTTVVLTKSTSSTGIDLKGTPKDVKFHIQTFWGAPIYNANVSIQGVSTTTGNWDWLAVLLSISLGETPINTTEMSGFTDTNGDIVFLMLDTIKYNVTVSASGYTFPTMIISPQASQYTISANMNQTWFISGNNTLENVNVTVSWVSHNDTYSFMNITYDDQTGTTTGGTIYIYKDSVGRVANQSPYATLDITDSSCNNSTLLDIPTGGVSYRVDVNATTSTGNNIVRTFTHYFKGSPVNLPGFTPETLLWLSLFIIFFTAAFAGATHSPQMAIIICVESWVLWAIGWLDGLITEFWYGETAVFGYLVLATFITIWWNIQEGKAKGKRSS